MALQEAAVGVAGADGLQLVGIAQEDNLGPALLGLVKDAAELAGIDHPGLVHDENRSAVEPIVPFGPQFLQARERAGLLLQALGGLACQRTP